MTSVFGPLVDAGRLADHLHEPGLVVIDMRWYLDRPGEGRVQYQAGHIPGAVFCDLEAGVTGREGPGRHPLPERAGFEETMRTLGVEQGDRVVAYDDSGGSIAARLWFLMRYFGHDDVAVLDGGLQAWTGPLESGEVIPHRGDFAASEPRREWVVSYAEVALTDATLLDARSLERYTGAVEPTGVRAGHIPGARSAFWDGNLRSDRRFKSPVELRDRFGGLGVAAGDAIVYCGSGVTACHDLLALELAGLAGCRLYEGSWSEWAVRDDAEIRTGEQP